MKLPYIAIDISISVIIIFAILVLMYIWANSLRAVYKILIEIKTKIISSEIFIKTDEETEDTIRQEAFSIRREQYDDLSKRYVNLLKSHSETMKLHDVLIESRLDMIKFIQDNISPATMPKFATQNLDELQKYYRSLNVEEEKK